VLRVLAIVGVLAAVACCAIRPPDARADRPEPAPRPVLLLFPGGGFIFDIERLPYAVRAARRAGFEPRFVDYPENDLPRAVRAARRAARRATRHGRDVYAYGESAGGTLAGLLAQDGLVARSATYCPLADLPGFISRSYDPALYQALIKAGDRELREYSPGFHRSARQILAMRAADDSPFINQAIRRWDRRDRRTRSMQVPGAHLDPEHPAIYRRNVRSGLAWLARSGGLD
jgi:acetyl esterase/lipase